MRETEDDTIGSQDTDPCPCNDDEFLQPPPGLIEGRFGSVQAALPWNTYASYLNITHAKAEGMLLKKETPMLLRPSHLVSWCHTGLPRLWVRSFLIRSSRESKLHPKTPTARSRKIVRIFPPFHRFWFGLSARWSPPNRIRCCYVARFDLPWQRIRG
jgi:hypothetical protein